MWHFGSQLLGGTKTINVWFAWAFIQMGMNIVSDIFACFSAFLGLSKILYTLATAVCGTANRKKLSAQ